MHGGPEDDAYLRGSGATPTEPGDPRRIGSFKLLGVLGTGGMGRVYLGTSAGQYAAVKQVLPALAADKDFLRHFGHELDNLAKLPTGVSARLLAGDRTAQPPWFATEYIPGITLSEALRLHGGPLPADSLWRLLRDGANGLRADRHRSGHRACGVRGEPAAGRGGRTGAAGAGRGRARPRRAPRPVRGRQDRTRSPQTAPHPGAACRDPRRGDRGHHADPRTRALRYRPPTSGDKFRLVSQGTGQCLKSNGPAGISIEGCNGSESQTWRIGATASNGHILENIAEKLCLQMVSSYGFQTVACNSSEAAQLWRNS